MTGRKLILPVLLTLTLAACGDAEQKPGPGAGGRPPQQVSVLPMKKSEQPITTVLPGRASAYQTAEIRPRVSGEIKEIAYQEGGEVKAGDLLYKIEDSVYAAEVERAKASLSKAEASVPTAKANLARYERLVNSGATQMEFENARLTLLQAQADVEQANAALRSAQINLDLTEIRAPFDGQTSISNVSIGNIVTANQTTALTILRRMDPIYIDLIDSSANLLQLRSAMASGRLSGDPRKADIHLKMEDGSDYELPGKINMADLAVSQSTGTYQIRAVFDNPKDLILPGTYVRATVSLGNESGYLIPQRAATRNARGELSARFVSAENKVETRTFTKSSNSGNSWLVTEGIADGDKLILDGFQWIADGAPVQPVEASLDEKGLVVLPTPPAAAPAK